MNDHDITPPDGARSEQISFPSFPAWRWTLTGDARVFMIATLGKYDLATGALLWHCTCQLTAKTGTEPILRLITEGADADRALHCPVCAAVWGGEALGAFWLGVTTMTRQTLACEHLTPPPTLQ